MKERPILFSGPMVRAILDDRKKMTRRVVKNQPGPTTVGYTELLPGRFKPVHSLREFIGDIGSEDHKKALDEFWADENNETLSSPFQVGQHLWCRETWGYVLDNGRDLVYRASIHEGLFTDRNTKWLSPLFMPRSLSRLTLEITAVRVERVQDITEEDVLAEGLALQGWVGHESDWPRTAGFAQLWDSLNAKRGYGWDLNPFVWVISFKRIQP